MIRPERSSRAHFSPCSQPKCSRILPPLVNTSVDVAISQFTGVEADSEVILDRLIKADSWKWIYSQVIEERVVDNDYQAIVHVSDRGSDVRIFPFSI